MSKKQIGIIIVLALVQFTVILDFMIMMPLVNVFKSVLNTDSKGFSLLVSSYNIAAFFSALTSSLYNDRFDRKKALLFNYTFFILSTYACALSKDYHAFLLARIMAGLFGGVCGSISLSIIGDIIPPQYRGSAMGIFMMGFSLASIVGVPFGAYLASEGAYQLPFYAICLIGLVVIVVAMVFIPPINKHLESKSIDNPIKNIVSVLSVPNHRMAILLGMLMMFAHMALIPFLSDFLQNNVGITQKQIPLMYLFGGLASIFSSLYAGKLSDKFGKYKVFVALCLLSLFPLFMIPNLGKHALWYVLTITTTFFIFSGGRMIPSGAIITSAINPQQRGTFLSINSASQNLASGLCTLIGGLIIYNGPHGEVLNYSYVGLVSVLATFLCIIVAKKVKVLG